MISFECSGCGKQIKVKDELAGKKGKCPGCGKPITVPAARETLAAAVSESGKVSPVPGSRPVDDGKRTLSPQGSAEAQTLAIEVFSYSMHFAWDWT